MCIFYSIMQRKKHAKKHVKHRAVVVSPCIRTSIRGSDIPDSFAGQSELEETQKLIISLLPPCIMEIGDCSIEGLPTPIMLYIKRSRVQEYPT